MEPADAVLLVGTQNIFERAQRGWFDFRLAALAPGALRPGIGSAHLPRRLLLEGRIQKAGLHVVHPVAAVMLLRRAIEQNFLQFFDGASIDKGELTVLQFRMALT